MFTIPNNYIGINIGSVSVNVVRLDDQGNLQTEKEPHYGRPKEVLNKLLEQKIKTKDNNFGISGSFGDLSETVAVERGIKAYDEQFDLVLSLGGEAIVLYVLDEAGHIANVLSHDKCAAGSGEFFIQQIDRLELSLPEAISLAQKGKRIELASRCSVHCKSDITHKLNRGEAPVEDLLTSVLASMVDKVNGLIIQSRVDVQRMLVIGGVTLNQAFMQLLREELSDVEVVRKETSPVFEAYGTALLVKDEPKSQEVTLRSSKSFSTLPALEQYREKVTIIEPEETTNPLGKREKITKERPWLLGVDVGSTTTKAVLVDPDDLTVQATYYGRTSGNPIKATRKGIQEIIRQVGDQKIQLVGVTGSGRQLVAAYLGTSAVYNEISAHAKGAAYYDPEVDTIFEIGGQDSKYMFLQNGVPVDYAMNASCSAGTGSFLEESAKGDLGIHVFDIAKTAMKAKNPVRFKADCAAFINTDIRTALQEDYGQENIVGGLVYSIVDNYLNKVKGSRQVGKKVFFQGGVAKNHAVGYAFAQATGKQIIIPPNPELVGAFGIALIAKTKYEQHEITGMPEQTTLETLIKEELKHLGSFTCKGCKNYCQIERYEVGGRKFPFGGSCTRYEHQWKRAEKTKEKEDLVALRNKLVLRTKGRRKKGTTENNGTIGIPRALLTHSFYPLFSTFFEELGYEVVLSGIDKNKEILTNAAFCYPVQILHGAIFDLIKQGISKIFLPHVLNATKGEPWLDATFCPITQASPYYSSVLFKGTTFLSPVLDFVEGYEEETALIEIAVKKLQEPRTTAEEAYEKAVKEQKKVEEKFLEKGRKAIKNIAKKEDEIGIVLVGRSYNAFPPETSLLIPKKLASMGVTVIPFDFLEKKGKGDIPWYFGNYVKAAIDLVKEQENLFLLYINSFSCTIDAFIQNYVHSEIKDKPYLMLELDAHTADAGIQTRLEAFLEIIRNFQGSKKKKEEEPFQMAKVKKRGGEVVVFSSKGKKLSIKDPRVKLYLPPFSKYHTDIGAKTLELFGYHTGESSDIILDYPVKGLRYSSGKECVPLPIILGHLATVVENRKPGELLGYYMIRGGAPCAVYSYFHYLEQFIEDNKLEDVFIFRFDYLTQYLGMKIQDIIRYGPKIVVLGDIMNEIESALAVIGKEGSVEQLKQYWDEFINNVQEKKDFNEEMEKLITKISAIPRTKSPKKLPKVLVSGDFFVRFSPFFIKELRKIYGKKGILVKSTDLFELVLYSIHYQGGFYVSRRWKMDPDDPATIMRASATPWKAESRALLLGKLALRVMHGIERNLRKRFEETGLLYAEPNNLRKLFKYATPWINKEIFGEAIPTIGKGMETLEEGNYDTLILTGPINCLPYKISQAILKPIYLKNNMPFLVFDVDISTITPNMKRLIHANIEQIKRKQKEKEEAEKAKAEKMEKRTIDQRIREAFQKLIKT
ncbi:MAG: hypothetical protein GF308_20535 [Candidatus Heimdallarchaeota archaeon]|nr:hypothetical protein [Candidatus Heimdallarchaeota archaeon]